MKLSVLSLGLLALLTPLTAAWTKEDREIFTLRDEIATHEGADVTFYDFLGITPSATQEDINKAYKKKSKLLHPDKVKQQLSAERARANKKKGTAGKKPGVNVVKPPTQSEIKTAVKEASDRQARLSIVANILRGEGRERYDHFLANGFPVWKGTGYYYNRYRPGLGTVMFGVLLFGGGAAHYLALYLGWKRQREFVERYIRFARHAAWGENLGINVPGVDTAPAPAPPPPPAAGDDERPMAMNRKQRRMQERDAKREAAGETKPARRGGRRLGTGNSGTATPTQAAGGPTGAKKRVVAENGKVLVVDSLGDVYLEQEDEEGNVAEFLLDPNELAQPSIKDTALYRMPIWLYGLTVGRVLSKKEQGEDSDSDDVAEDYREVNAADTDDSEGPGKRTPSTGSADDGFELLDKSVEDLGKATGSQAQQKQGKSGKRKGKKR